ncbi:hypothetical protein SSAG_00271 [Streptomyces sp. Mg1]|nr:hypothetical protein SSAG_00271 [Streptomyces sp. Mg1]
MSHAFQSMDASRFMRKAEVIALVPAAQHSKTPTPKAWARGTSEPRQLTQTLHADDGLSPEGNEHASRPDMHGWACPPRPAGTPASGRCRWTHLGR